MNHVTRTLASWGFCLKRYVTLEELRYRIRTLRPIVTDYPLVRVGDNADGGYLIPDDLVGVSACFSPGVDVKASFEMALVGKNIRDLYTCVT